MRPRILLRTHYQADEPRIIIATVTECTTPTETRTEDTVAAALVRWAREHGQTISVPGAVYAVGNARALDLLNKSNRWTATGLAFGYLRHSGRGPAEVASAKLSTPEQKLYLKQYLLEAGALLIKFGWWLLDHGSTNDEELRKKSIVEELLVEALNDYLTLMTEIRDRALVRRERDRLMRSEYAASTKRHKRYPLLTTMERLRLLDVERAGDVRVAISADRNGCLKALLRAVPDIAALERLGRDEAVRERLAEAISVAPRDDPPQALRPEALISGAYRYALDQGLQACPLSFLDDLLYAVFAASRDAPATVMSADAILDSLHRRLPGEVRFHVDRRGRRAFVLLSNQVLEGLGAS